MKKLIGWPVGWALFWIGDGFSFLCNRYNWLSWMYIPYNKFMIWSVYVNDWAGLDIWKAEYTETEYELYDRIAKLAHRNAELREALEKISRLASYKAEEVEEFIQTLKSDTPDLRSEISYIADEALEEKEDEQE